MSLVTEYKRQFDWRPWPQIFRVLPPLQGKVVLDLGCGVGDQAAELASRGAHVIGIDMNEELLREAKSRGIENAEFHLADLNAPLDPGISADGLWCSFTPAYFPDLTAALNLWKKNLRPGGWAALTDIDNLFSHEPLSDRTRKLLDGYARDSLKAGRYDFRIGHKFRMHLRRSGFVVSKQLKLEDLELSFSGPAFPEVVEAWRDRFNRMKLLRDYCGTEFEQVRDEFLSCLLRPDHRSLAKVYFCLGALPSSL